jgi:hypothetical protein
MKFITGLCKRIFRLLLHLFPAKFQHEYGEELQSDFDRQLEEARSVSGGEFLAVCLREPRDLPVNLLRTHLEKKRMVRILHSQSFRFGWKGAFAFGVSLVGVHVLDGVINTALIRFDIWHFQVWMGDAPQQSWVLMNMAENVLSYAVASIVGGFLFAVLFTGKFRFWRTANLGTIGFLVPGLIYRVLMFSTYVSLPWFGWAMNAIAGMFLGAIVALRAETRLRKIALAGAGAILYPVLYWSSFRLIGSLFPTAYPGITTSYEAYRQIILGFMVAGLFYGFLLGSMLGWGRRTIMPQETNNERGSD